MPDAILRGWIGTERREEVLLFCGKTVLLLLLAVASVADLGAADDVKPTLYYQNVEIEVTPQQLEKLYAVEDRHGPEISRQYDGLKTHEDESLPEAKAFRDKIRELERARDAEIEASL